MFLFDDNFQKEIKKLIKNADFTVKEVAKKIGITEAGLHSAIRNNSLKVRDLKKIFEIIGRDYVLVDNFAYYHNTEKHSQRQLDLEQCIDNNELMLSDIKEISKEVEMLKEIINSLRSENKALKELNELLKKNKPTIV